MEHKHDTYTQKLLKEIAHEISRTEIWHTPSRSKTEYNARRLRRALAKKNKRKK